MGTLTSGPWKGVDQRRALDSADPMTLQYAVNVDLYTDGTIKARDGAQPIAQLDARSVGLYTVNGVLCTVVPAGHSIPAYQVAPGVTIAYTAIGDGTIYPTSVITGLPAVASWGSSPSAGVYPYVVIQRSNGLYEHHWITSVPAPSVNGSPPPAYLPGNAAINTKIALPFPPGPAVLKMSSKMWAPDNVNGLLRFSSTTNGPSDWTLINDAGFLAILQNVTGDRNMTGLGFYDGMAAIFFPDSIQLWQVSADPAQIALVRVLDGPGTLYPRSVINVRGDIVYVSRGVVSSTKRVAITGQLQDGDIGAPIAPATKQLTATPNAMWSQARAQYIIAWGNTVWLYTTSPTTKVFGWTSWVFPFTCDYIVELDGVLYIRSGNTLYRLTTGYVDGSQFSVTSQFLGSNGKRKFFTTFDVSQIGTSQVSILPDVRIPTLADPQFTSDGASGPIDDLWLGETTESLAVQFTGAIGQNLTYPNGQQGGWKLDQFRLNFSAAKR